MGQLEEDLETVLDETLQKCAGALYQGYDPRVERLKPLLREVLIGVQRRALEEAHAEATKEEPQVVIKLSMLEAMAMSLVLGAVRKWRSSFSPRSMNTDLLNQIMEADKTYEEVQKRK